MDAGIVPISEGSERAFRRRYVDGEFHRIARRAHPSVGPDLGKQGLPRPDRGCVHIRQARRMAVSRGRWTWRASAATRCAWLQPTVCIEKTQLNEVGTTIIVASHRQPHRRHHTLISSAAAFFFFCCCQSRHPPSPSPPRHHPHWLTIMPSPSSTPPPTPPATTLPPCSNQPLHPPHTPPNSAEPCCYQVCMHKLAPPGGCHAATPHQIHHPCSM